MGREVGTKPCYLLEAYESKLAVALLTALDQRTTGQNSC